MRELQARAENLERTCRALPGRPGRCARGYAERSKESYLPCSARTTRQVRDRLHAAGKLPGACRALPGRPGRCAGRGGDDRSARKAAVLCPDDQAGARPFGSAEGKPRNLPCSARTTRQVRCQEEPKDQSGGRLPCSARTTRQVRPARAVRPPHGQRLPCSARTTRQVRGRLWSCSALKVPCSARTTRQVRLEDPYRQSRQATLPCSARTTRQVRTGEHRPTHRPVPAVLCPDDQAGAREGRRQPSRESVLPCSARTTRQVRPGFLVLSSWQSLPGTRRLARSTPRHGR